MSEEVKSFEDLKGSVEGSEPPEPETVVIREPIRDEFGRSYATGKRKDAVARVWVKPGSGRITVNGKEMAAYFARPVLQMVIGQPFKIANIDGQFDVMATVKGGGLSGQAGAAGHVITMIEVADKFEQGDYLYGATELYKHFMGKAIPWAGMVEGLQSLVEAIAPGSVKNSKIFQVIRACDPIGLGASGVDSMTTLVLGTIHLIQTGEIDTARLNRLVARMKQGPTKIFADMGEELGDSLYEMSRWRRDDWSYAVKSIPGFIASWF